MKFSYHHADNFPLYQMMKVTLITHFFNINSISCSQTQYPLQDTFALIIDKTQGLSLNHISLMLDASLFSPSQVYMTLSWGMELSGVTLMHLDKAAFLVDPDVVAECECLEGIWNRHQVAIMT